MRYIMGPFAKLDKPILSPNPEATFNCPILNKLVRWEEQNVYNPAAVVKDGKVFILYRADDTPRSEGWGRTCRIGLAYSEDGYNFTRLPEPVLYPDNDFMKDYEWEGGTEDLHIIEDENGTYYINYTSWNGTSDAQCIATSTDLIHWNKHGTAFGDAYDGRYVKGSRSGVVVSRIEGERLIATKIKVQIGLNIKQKSPHKLTFVAGCTNGYIYYAPTAEQLGNVGRAQENCDCLLAPNWQRIYEEKAYEILRRLA